MAALCSSALDKSRSHNTLIQLFTESLVSARHCSNAGDTDRHEQQGQKPLCSPVQSRSQIKPRSRMNGRSDVVNVWRIVKHGGLLNGEIGRPQGLDDLKEGSRSLAVEGKSVL